MQKGLIIVLTAIFIYACQPAERVTENQDIETPTEFDSVLAAEFGADEYGMRTYIMANLIAGPNRSQDSATAAQLQRAHLDNINRLAEEGKLVLAGPFLDRKEVRGIYIFAVESIEEAEALTNTDPAIQAGRLQMELRPWYATAALMGMKDLQLKLARKKI